MKNKSEFSKQLGKVYSDILSIKIEMSDSFETSLNKFYDVMRKHGICQGTWSKNGRTVSNAEWIMCYNIFKSHKLMALDIFLILNEPPEDLLAYGENPHKKDKK